MAPKITTNTNKDYFYGQPCAVNDSHDLFMVNEAREFIGAECIVVKRTKSGLIMIALADNHKKMISLPKRNIILI